MDDFLRNRTFDELQSGDTASIARLVGHDDIDLFAAISGDQNPAHLDAAFAKTGLFGHVVAHGMWTAALISAVLGTRLPGPGTIYLGQDLHFLKPVTPGDTITTTVTVKEKQPQKRIVLLDTTCTNRENKVVLKGTATVIAPEHGIEWPRTRLPDVSLRRHDRYESLVKRARVQRCVPPSCIPARPQRLPGRWRHARPVCWNRSLSGRRAGFEPPRTSRSTESRSSLSRIATPRPRTVELAVAGSVCVLVKGSLHTDELLGAVVAPGSGLRTERRISHVYAMDIPAYDKPLIVTDAAINIQPTLEHKRDICQNAVDLLRRLGLEEPKVAVLAAVAVVVAGQLLFTFAPFMHALFDSAPIALPDGLLILAAGLMTMVVLELEKTLLRKISSATLSGA